MNNQILNIVVIIDYTLFLNILSYQPINANLRFWLISIELCYQKLWGFI